MDSQEAVDGELLGAPCAGRTDLFFAECKGCAWDVPVGRRPRGAHVAGCQALEALALCTRCPVQEECRDDALTHGEKYGVWGGTTPRQRRELLPAGFRRPRARRIPRLAAA